MIEVAILLATCYAMGAHAWWLKNITIKPARRSELDALTIMYTDLSNKAIHQHDALVKVEEEIHRLKKSVEKYDKIANNAAVASAFVPRSKREAHA